MPSQIVVVASTLTMGCTADWFPGIDTGSPMISMNFASEEFTEAIVRELLVPHGKPECFVVGLSAAGKNFEIFLYGVIKSTRLASLPIDGYETTLIGEFQPPYVYLIGNEVDFSVAQVADFLDRKARIGKFYVACGHRPRGESGMVSVNHGWIACLTTILGRSECEARLNALAGI